LNTYPNSAVEVLQLLLRCGMVCQEELNVVLEMMPARFRQPGAGDAETADTRQCYPSLMVPESD
jgi:hypothetical protein